MSERFLFDLEATRDFAKGFGTPYMWKEGSRDRQELQRTRFVAAILLAGLYFSFQHVYS
jgi:hypothetical protein